MRGSRCRGGGQGVLVPRKNSQSKDTEHKSWTLPTLFLRTPTYPLPLFKKILDSCMNVENNYECMRRTVRLLGTCINITLICENQIRYK